MNAIQDEIEKMESLLTNSEYRKILFSDSLNMNLLVTMIEKRFIDLEDKVYVKEGVTTRPQQMLILYHLGIIDKINELNINKKQKAKLLSVLLNADADNIEGDLPKKNSKVEVTKDLKNPTNYKFLKKIFKEVGLVELAEKVDLELDEMEKARDISESAEDLERKKNKF